MNRWKKPLALTLFPLVGAALGYAYYHFIGCQGG